MYTFIFAYIFYQELDFPLLYINFLSASISVPVSLTHRGSGVQSPYGPFT